MKKFINQKDMKLTNTADVFDLIRKSGRITRRQIADKTNMSWGAVSTITAQLIEDGYILEVKSDEGGVGRTPYYLEVNGDVHFSLGIDVNNTGLRAVLVNLKNETVESISESADFSDRDTLMRHICSFTERALELAAERHVICIGLAMQGIVDSKNGISISLSDCKGWENVPLTYILSERFGLPVFIEHDPNCILYAISAPLRKDTMLVRIDRGIGMAVMLGGKIIDKPGIFELGHTVVDPDGDECLCGRHGCLEMYASQSGLERRSEMSFASLTERAKNGDADAKKHFVIMARHLSYAISNVAHLLGIKNIILCGDMCDCKELFFEDFIKYNKLYDPKGSLELSFSDVSNAALGAAMISTRITLKEIEIENKKEN